MERSVVMAYKCSVSAMQRWFVILLLLAVTGSAQEPNDAPLKRLAAVEVFAFGGIGDAGVTSQGELDFKVVIRQPREAALAAFEKLYATGNPQAKAYALSGIKKLKPKRYKELLAATRTSTDEVQVMRGCIITHELLRDVAKQIDAGYFRF